MCVCGVVGLGVGMRENSWCLSIITWCREFGKVVRRVVCSLVMCSVGEYYRYVL